jgi:hypothetical protein
LLVLVIPALSFIALLNDARRYLVSVHLTRASPSNSKPFERSHD